MCTVETVDHVLVWLHQDSTDVELTVINEMNMNNNTTVLVSRLILVQVQTTVTQQLLLKYSSNLFLPVIQVCL